jgi:hypothetical protein
MKSAKKIQIKDLPESYFREQLMLIAKTPEEEVWIVAKSGGRGDDWSAYIGWPKYLSAYGEEMDPTLYYRTMLASISGVESNDDKLDEVTAKLVFPDITYEYRR